MQEPGRAPGSFAFWLRGVGDDDEPFVVDPAEAAAPPRLARLAPATSTIALLLLLIAGTTLYWTGRGEEDRLRIVRVSGVPR
ncbi:MAG: hypothetical protein GEU74_08285 [Nitriliruptorales bacterium]|nr:hypothetical protein [Nitriliruptorales bacterium]